MKLLKFSSGVIVTLVAEVVLAGVIVYGAWKYDTQR